MDTIWGFIKFLFWCALIFCIIGIIATVSCIKKAQHHYGGADVYIPDVSEPVDVDIPDVKKDPDVIQPSSITWVSTDSLGGTNRCVMLYFATAGCCSGFEQSVFNDSDVISLVNRKFLSSRVPDNPKLHQRFNIHVFPTIMLLPNGGKGTKIGGEVSASKLISLMNDSKFDGC